MVADYRGATVEDLDPLPVVSVTPNTLLGTALDMSYENSFTYLPVLTEDKKLLGYLTTEQLESSSPAERGQPVKQHYTKFQKSNKFVPITPATPLEDLAKFFSSGNDFAVITDDDRRFVLGVATPEDLKKYEDSRPFLKVVN